MKCGIGRKWRDAATLIVLSKKNVQSVITRCNYDVLLQTRTQRGSFKNAVVFPGGVTESADSEHGWRQLLASFGYSQADFAALHRPGTTVTPLLQSDPVQRHISLRITAIRETFEELGLLICSRTHKKDKTEIWAEVVSDFNVKHWQDRVSKNPNDLLALCEELNCYPDIWSLHYWSDWLTPASFPKRFDTGFFITALKDRPDTDIGSEVAKVEWLSPQEILERSQQPEVLIYPPQSYELHRLAQWVDVKEFIKFAKIRSSFGSDLHYHANVEARDGYLFVFPGDDLYPENIDLQEPLLIRSNKTVKELRDSSKVVNRFEFHNSQTYLVLKNIIENGMAMKNINTPVHITLSN